ncbi:MAG: BamA/TamA family outer membrane protein, partial [candidate division KSB1 bacterium]|nr:BamA/TamA family outer membrane protein [candidate division KSB1 bacterium]
NGVNLFYQESIGETMSAGLTYIFEQVDLDLNSLAAPRVTDELRGLYNKSSLLFAVSKNTTDDLFAPNEGTRFTLSAKYSGLGAGEYHYSKWLMDIRRYQQRLGGVVAARISVGKIDSYDPIKVVPVEDLFFSGGANSIRGWGRYELGPRADDGKPLGGTAIFEASLEMRLPLYRFLQSALFIDAGNVFIDRLNLLDSRIAVGCGLRFKTPVGPLRLDLARPISESGALRWHLTVGEAF